MTKSDSCLARTTKSSTHVSKRLLEMLSRWPRYLSQGPAALMWSVVHLPSTLVGIGASSISFPSHRLNGSRSWRRLLVRRERESEGGMQGGRKGEREREGERGRERGRAKHVDGLQCDSWILLKCFRSRVMAGSP